jgi:aryl-alcohol dehydrogenase-like predicted oxidoreductase
MKAGSDPANPSRRRALRLAAALAALAAMNAETAAAEAAILRRPIPRSGERLPVVGLGTWQTFDVGPRAPERAELKEVLRLLSEVGAVVDSSPMYGEAERVVGDLAAELGVRERLFFATKVWTSGREAGVRQMESSLQRMRTQRMDLMQVHNLVDVAGHAPTLREWKERGRVRYIGVTHYHSGAYRELERLVATREWDFAQFNYSIAEREAEARLLPACAAAGVAVLVNRPFAEGSLFRKVRGKPLPPWAAEFDCTSWAQFFLKYILAHPAVTCAIPGTRRVRHLQDNLLAGTGRLPDEAMRRRMVEYIGEL